ncbi:hypothetical protein GGH97_002949 [Coemansia sp. RSA 475]|nr:hypothetical protein GGH97_002949 [Coemansia sp. RSA 475]
MPLGENFMPPIPPRGLSDMSSPYNLTAGSTQQTDPSNDSCSPILGNYTLGQQMSQFPNPTGFTPDISPSACSLKIPEIADVPITHSHSYQPMAFEPASDSKKTKPRPPRNKSKFKRFRNAFIYYVNDQRDKVGESTKKLKNREFLQLMSARWKSLSEEERSPYVKLAEEDKKRFNEDQARFGKYESRQRRYNKVRPGHHGTAPYALPDPQFPGMFAAPPGLMYGGYGNVASAYANAAALSPLYLNLQKATPESMAAAVASMQANPQYSVLPGPHIHQPPSQQQQSSFLAPPPLAQRNSTSSTTSSNDLNDLQLSLSQSRGYNWNMPGTQGGIPTEAANDALSAQMSMQGRYPAAALCQQHPSPGLMQTPTGVPISHSLTEPVLYDNSSLNLALSGNWPQQQ